MKCCKALLGDVLQFLADVVVVCRSLNLECKTSIVWCACWHEDCRCAESCLVSPYFYNFVIPFIARVLCRS
jgi:hypothetical protein